MDRVRKIFPSLYYDNRDEYDRRVAEWSRSDVEREEKEKAALREEKERKVWEKISK